MFVINFCATFLTALVLLSTLKDAAAHPVKRDLIEVDLGGENCFEVKRDLIYPDLGAHNCGGYGGRGGRGGRGYRGGYCCGY